MSQDTYKTSWKTIKGKGWMYWLRVLVLGIGGLWLGQWLTDTNPPWLRDIRYRLYQIVTDATSRDASTVGISLVLISDEEYWKGELAGRSPLKRDYLAKLIETLCSARPRTIALDFIMRSPVTDGAVADHPDYKDETKKLADSIRTASKNCKIVLPLTFYCSSDSTCVQENSVLDTYEFDSERVFKGYINLAPDVRRVPLWLSDINERRVESFALAIARADDITKATRAPKEGKFPYGSFIFPKQFQDEKRVFSAGQILTLSPKELSDAVATRTVIIGGQWGSRAYMRGPLVDLHASPVGELSGVYLHANYAAAILDQRMYPGLGRIADDAIEFCVVALVAILFALDLNPRRRWLHLIVAVAVLGFLGYVLWQNFGIFFEFTIPVILLSLHWLYDEYRHMRRELIRLRQQLAVTRTEIDA